MLGSFSDAANPVWYKRPCCQRPPGRPGGSDQHRNL